MHYHINKAEFDVLVARGWQVIDVRDPYELVSYGKYEPSLNIPYPKIITNRETLFPDKDSRLIIICNYGNRSGLTARHFQQQGYENVYVLERGLQELS
ncbi:rhodanese-like domain-containing protein [Mesoplasma syrphidae]|uniref:Rhodanese-like domain-containing protein n=1 Tax=Mesoplasma syrphidae TaxID=225999 RepID=A0A2K9CDZ6_9MOLU|nr:rhodanese-like domain-containing protein [Mesoplasma syrphidae]AUF83874.1 rhodanese-like domain-containing protein [Mesoplasma syrphidae]